MNKRLTVAQVTPEGEGCPLNTSSVCGVDFQYISESLCDVDCNMNLCSELNDYSVSRITASKSTQMHVNLAQKKSICGTIHCTLSSSGVEMCTRNGKTHVFTSYLEELFKNNSSSQCMVRFHPSSFHSTSRSRPTSLPLQGVSSKEYPGLLCAVGCDTALILVYDTRTTPEVPLNDAYNSAVEHRVSPNATSYARHAPSSMDRIDRMTPSPSVGITTNVAGERPESSLSTTDSIGRRNLRRSYSHNSACSAALTTTSTSVSKTPSESVPCWLREMAPSPNSPLAPTSPLGLSPSPVINTQESLNSTSDGIDDTLSPEETPQSNSIRQTIPFSQSATTSVSPPYSYLSPCGESGSRSIFPELQMETVNGGETMNLEYSNVDDEDGPLFASNGEAPLGKMVSAVGGLFSSVMQGAAVVLGGASGEPKSQCSSGMPDNSSSTRVRTATSPTNIDHNVEQHSKSSRPPSTPTKDPSLSSVDDMKEKQVVTIEAIEGADRWDGPGANEVRNALERLFNEHKVGPKSKDTLIDCVLFRRVPPTTAAEKLCRLVCPSVSTKRKRGLEESEYIHDNKVSKRLNGISAVLLGMMGFSSRYSELTTGRKECGSTETDSSKLFVSCASGFLFVLLHLQTKLMDPKKYGKRKKRDGAMKFSKMVQRGVMRAMSVLAHIFAQNPTDDDFVPNVSATNIHLSAVETRWLLLEQCGLSFVVYSEQQVTLSGGRRGVQRPDRQYMGIRDVVRFLRSRYATHLSEIVEGIVADMEDPDDLRKEEDQVTACTPRFRPFSKQKTADAECAAEHKPEEHIVRPPLKHHIRGRLPTDVLAPTHSKSGIAQSATQGRDRASPVFPIDAKISSAKDILSESSSFTQPRKRNSLLSAPRSSTVGKRSDMEGRLKKQHSVSTGTCATHVSSFPSQPRSRSLSPALFESKPGRTERHQSKRRRMLSEELKAEKASMISRPASAAASLSTPVRRTRAIVEDTPLRNQK